MRRYFLYPGSSACRVLSPRTVRRTNRPMETIRGTNDQDFNEQRLYTGISDSRKLQSECRILIAGQISPHVNQRAGMGQAPGPHITLQNCCK